MKFVLLYVGFNKSSNLNTLGMGPFVVTTAVLLLLHTEFVLTDCPSGCASCLDSTCTNCEPSFYLADDNCHPCPENCLGCTDQTNCTKCKANKWGTGGSQCLYDCSKECLNGECHDDTGYCLNCEIGKYGRTCQFNCSDCKNDHCDLYRCVEGCKFGYYEYQTYNNYYVCLKCSANCIECDNGIFCRICNDGFYLNQFHYNGNTHVICVQCLNENECSNFCVIQGCNLCQLVNNKPICADCLEGETFNGVSCEQKTFQCSQGCSTNCNSNGICLGNCNDGFAGDRCTERCNVKCLICSNNDRNICVQCNGNFYSNNCSLPCSKLCKIEEGKQTCTLEDGYCLNGCERGYWGDTCINFCPENCQDHDCDRSTGTCTRGCKEGYTGDKCGPTTTINKKEPIVTITSAATSTATTTLVQNQACEVKIFIIGFFSGIGFSIVIVAIVILLYFMRRRYLGNKAPQNNNRNVEIPTYIETANNYESLSHNRTRHTVYSDLGTTE